MADENKTKISKTHVIEVVRHDGPLMIPEGPPMKAILTALENKMRWEEEEVEIHAPIKGAFMLDAAYALGKVLAKRFGFALTKTGWRDGFFGKVKVPPTLVSVEIAPGVFEQVPWGYIEIPGVEGELRCGATWDEGDNRMVFVIQGSVKQKHRDAINAIVEDIRAYVRENSIYRGQAFRLRLKDDAGEYKQMPEPKMMVLDPSLESEIIFSEQTERLIDTNLWTIIERTAEVRALGIPRKRGILLYGEYGTGKTLTATVTALKAKRNGWTFIVCDRADELADVLRLAREYSPVVVFCEDIDKVMTGRRNQSVDEVLNTIDGVESKAAELIVVLTTNNEKEITKALLRPGRLDAAIHVELPDSQAAIRLARSYGRGLIHDGEDLTSAGEVMANRNASIVREIVERAKLAALRTLEPGDPATIHERLRINGENLIDASATLDGHLALMADGDAVPLSDVEKAATIIANAPRNDIALLPVPTVPDKRPS